MLSVTHFCSRTAVGAFVLLIASFVLGPVQAHASAAATTTTLSITVGTTTVASVSSGIAVTLTATVKAGAAVVPAGQVKFCDALATHCTDIHVLGTGQLTASGSASFKFVPGPGVHSYKAEFLGTAADASSTSAASPFTVNGSPTVTAITQSGATGNYTLKATVTGTGSPIGPTGKVSFLDTSAQNAVLGTADLGTAVETFTWTTPQSPATSAAPHSIAVADFNGDGIPDIAIGTNGTTTTKNIGSINILLGNGDGTFQAAKTYAGLAGNQLMIAAPFVTGGAQDILAVNNSSLTTGNAILFLGDGKGGLGAGTTLSLGINTVTALISGDFNGDGNQDFIVGGQAFGVPAFNVFLGNGNGTFNSGTLNAASDVPITALGVGDFTGQGALDIAVVHSDGTVDIFLQDGEGDFYPNAGTNAGSSPTAIAIGDFNGDGKADLAITNSAQENVSILLGDGSGGFTAIASPPTGSLPASIAIGDFNADGFVDLAVANSGAATVTILLGKGDGTFTVEPVLDTGNTPVSLATGTFNGKDTADIAVVNEDPASNASTSTTTILLSQRSQSATASVNGIAPAAAGTHLVDASYAGDTTYKASVSTTTTLNGSGEQTAAPVLSPAAGTYAAAQKITLTDPTPGAVIYYTTNGSTPTTASSKYTAPIAVSTTSTIAAVAVASGYTQSIVATAKYVIETPASTPTFSVPTGTYGAKQTVTIADATPGAVIYYTNNGTAPTTNSAKYTVPFTVSASETVEAMAVASGYGNSAVASAKYVIQPPAATPAFSLAAGTYTGKQTVTLTDATPGAVIYYTNNGTAPTTNSAKYTVPFTVSASETVEAMAVASGYGNSAVASAKYVIQPPAATPAFSLAAGTYTGKQTVTLTDATPGAVIYYTNNGTAPTTNSAKYTVPFTVSASETVEAMAVATGYGNSVVATAKYVIQSPAATPAFSVASGTYAAKQTVTLTDATPGAVIYYTNNGTAPTVNSAKYTVPFTVSTSETVEAMAVATGYGNSAVATAKYVIQTPQ